MTNDLFLSVQATNDLSAIVKWYNLKHQTLGLAFIEEFEAILNAIRSNPNQFPLHYKSFQKAVLIRFPYNVYFRKSNTQIIIVAVTHQKRHPSIWRKRKR